MHTKNVIHLTFNVSVLQVLNNQINHKVVSICFSFSFKFFLQLLCISLVPLIFPYSAQILLENAFFCLQNVPSEIAYSARNSSSRIYHASLEQMHTAIWRAWYNGSHTMMAKAIRAVELHYPMIQFLIIIIIIVRKNRLHVYLGHTYLPQTTCRVLGPTQPCTVYFQIDLRSLNSFALILSTSQNYILAIRNKQITIKYNLLKIFLKI